MLTGGFTSIKEGSRIKEFEILFLAVDGRFKNWKEVLEVSSNY